MKKSDFLQVTFTPNQQPSQNKEGTGHLWKILTGVCISCKMAISLASVHGYSLPLRKLLINITQIFFSFAKIAELKKLTYDGTDSSIGKVAFG